MSQARALPLGFTGLATKLGHVIFRLCITHDRKVKLLCPRAVHSSPRALPPGLTRSTHLAAYLARIYVHLRLLGIIWHLELSRLLDSGSADAWSLQHRGRSLQRCCAAL